MSNFEDAFTKFVVKKERPIKSICAPLNDYLNIPIFTYTKLEACGKYVNLSNFSEALEGYYGKKMFLEDPHLIDPKLLRSGTLFIPDFYSSNYFQDICKQARIGQLLVILQSNGNSMEEFCFGLKEGNHSRTLISNLELLHSFTRYFKREAADIIKRGLSEGFDVKKTKGMLFSERSLSPLSRKDPQVQKFLNTMLPLTPREIQCVELFKEGKTAQMTAAILGLSQRTVESYFDNIKNKLGCKTKSDLLLL